MSELVKLERLTQDITVNGFCKYASIQNQKWYLEFDHSFIIHAAGWASSAKKMSDPANHGCIFDLVFYKDEAFVMLNYLVKFEGWGLRV